MALNDTPNIKTPGSNGIPSEQSSRLSAPNRTAVQTEGHWDCREVTQRCMEPVQGYPASPILFDFYINDLFNSIQGVYVPGLTSRIPGLLFADDAVLLAESEPDMKIELNKITDRLDTWEMIVTPSNFGLVYDSSHQIV
ncbi:hypothetical protein AYI68_g8171 [Smittium mucronatum]|uniref:Reverse transcriptase domain-containing protein n=1 Tax=Smittium mucronatum TaxID=133383 RepID=A0A1R0GLN2_9FUNG|nr:hypothetical protein AYI68_g8171 [Smittium mucronatum]